MRWFALFAPLVAVYWILIASAFIRLPPLRLVTESLACGPNEHLVSESHTSTTGSAVTGRTTTHNTTDCCARKDDTSPYPKCPKGNMSFEQGLPMLLPVGFGFVGSLTPALGLTLLIRFVWRRSRRG